jgi:CRP-like cAMP-binding protein
LLGELGTTFYVVLKGAVGVLINPQGNKHVDGQMREVKVIQAGEAFGELALIKNMPRAASIICKQDCHFGVLDKSHYKKILSNTFSVGIECS